MNCPFVKSPQTAFEGFSRPSIAVHKHKFIFIFFGQRNVLFPQFTKIPPKSMHEFAGHASSLTTSLACLHGHYLNKSTLKNILFLAGSRQSEPKGFLF